MLSPLDSTLLLNDPLDFDLQPLTATNVEVDEIASNITRDSSQFFEETIYDRFRLPDSLKKSRNFLQPYLNIKHFSKLNYIQLTNSIGHSQDLVKEYIVYFDDNVGIRNLLKGILLDMDKLKEHLCSNGGT
ncbi:hypothetical protein ACTFIU_003154 [Dictyostelium citrinum]